MRKDHLTTTDKLIFMKQLMLNLIYILIVSLFLNNSPLAFSQTGVLANSEANEFKIGIILPLTGSLAEVGATFRDACILAFEDAKPSKHTYRLLFEDDNLQSVRAATAAQKLLNVDKVSALVSTWSYGGIVVAPLAEKAKKIHFGVAWDPVVAKGKYNFLHLTPPDVFIRKILEGYKVKGFKNIYAFGVQESGSLFSIEELKRLTPEYGMNVIGESVFAMSDRDFRSELTRIGRLKADVFYANIPADADVFVRQAREVGIHTPIVVMTGYETASDLSLLEGSWYVSDSYLSSEFEQRFKERFHHASTYGIGNYYDIIRLIIWLAERSESTSLPNSEMLISQMTQLSGFTSLFGKLEVDTEGIIRYPARYFLIKDRKRVPVDNLQ